MSVGGVACARDSKMVAKGTREVSSSRSPGSSAQPRYRLKAQVRVLPLDTEAAGVNCFENQLRVGLAGVAGSRLAGTTHRKCRLTRGVGSQSPLAVGTVAKAAGEIIRRASGVDQMQTMRRRNRGPSPVDC